MSTWGLSDRVFLVIYAYLLVVMLAVALSRRSRISAGRSVDAASLDQYDVAMLNGGPRLVAAVALVNLDGDGAVELGDRLLRELAANQDIGLDAVARDGERLEELGIDMAVALSRPLPARAHPVEAAAYQAVERSHLRRPEHVLATVAQAQAVKEVRDRLVRRRLLIGSAQRAFLGRRWRWFMALGVVGLLRLVYGQHRGPALLLLVGLLAATVAAAVRPPGCTGADDGRDQRARQPAPKGARV